MRKTIIVILIICLVMLVITGCNEKTIQGNGDIQSKSYDFGDFDKLSIARDFHVNVQKGKEFEVTVKTNEDIFEYLDIKVESGALYANYKEDIVIENTSITMNIVMPLISDIKVENDGVVQLEDDFTCEGDFGITLNNDAKFIGNIVADNINVSINNDGDLMGKFVANTMEATLKNSAILTLLDGKAYAIKAHGYNSSHIFMKEFEVNSGDVYLENDATCEIYVVDNLNVTALNDTVINVYGGGKVNKIDVAEDAVVESIKE